MATADSTWPSPSQFYSFYVLWDLQGPPRCDISSVFRLLVGPESKVSPSESQLDKAISPDCFTATSSPASSAASPPPPSSSSSKLPANVQIPRNAPRAAELATAEAVTDIDNATASTSTPQPAPSALPQLRFHVGRTSSNQLPVYQDSKRGGNLHQTLIRKISGDARVLREDIREHLGLQEKDVVVNPVTGHVVVKVSLSSLSKPYWIFQHASCLRTRDL